MNFYERGTMVGAILVIGTTIVGAATPDWQVYCWMLGLMGWVFAASKYRRGQWR